ncbi:hypothetical protein [uncultured Jatrophihabitans sp.]|uniref:hypothetical protein n=1 Tax=uncultured Jatrophihabitans sp. TaxID=1610747 RepID=UPI0035CA1192
MNTPNPSAQADFYTAQLNRAIARHDDPLTHELVELADTELPDSELPDTELPDTGLPDTGLPDTELPHRTTRRDRSRPRAWRLMHRVDAWTLWALNARTDREE